MTEISNKGANEFITRDDFIDWVLHPTPMSDSYWEQFIHDNPSSKPDIEEALFIIKNISPRERLMDDMKKRALWNDISEKTIESPHSRRFYAWPAAASVVAVMFLSVLMYVSGNLGDEIMDFASVKKINKNSNEVRLIFSDNSEETFDLNDLDIKYDKDGRIEITTENSVKSAEISNEILHTESKIREKKQAPGVLGNKEPQMNQLVVPRGKRTSLTLSDGTRLYLNSGSRAIFPVKFPGEKRELYIEGEAYIEVAHDPQRPFTVSVNDMKIRVVGTKFNISAYPEDPCCSVVLVEGEVQAEIHSRRITIAPNYLLTYRKDSKETSLSKTEVTPHLSWKDGWLYCDKQELRVVAGKLSRYYDIDIQFRDEEAAELLLSGKLDLKTECADIFKAISTIAPISYEETGNGIIISKRSN